MHGLTDRWRPVGGRQLQPRDHVDQMHLVTRLVPARRARAGAQKGGAGLGGRVGRRGGVREAEAEAGKGAGQQAAGWLAPQPLGVHRPQLPVFFQAPQAAASGETHRFFMAHFTADSQASLLSTLMSRRRGCASDMTSSTGGSDWKGGNSLSYCMRMLNFDQRLMSGLSGAGPSALQCLADQDQMASWRPGERRWDIT